METDNAIESEAPPASADACSHQTTLAVWGIPPLVRIGSAFSVKVGLQCLSGCDLSGCVVEIRDETGTNIGEGTIGSLPWSETSSLFWTEVEMKAPGAPGVCRGHVRFHGSARASADAAAHESASSEFTFRVDPPPDHCVTVKVTDRDTSAPVDDVEVRLGRYMASTDERGVANIEVPGGAYVLTIRRDGYRAEPASVDVHGSLTVDLPAWVVPTRAEREMTMTTMSDSWG